MDARKLCKSYKRCKGDGKMPRLTIQSVYQLPLGKRALKLGIKGKDVLCLQKTLAELGFYHGKESGWYDFLTREAVKVFQRSYQLSADGITGADTIKLLQEKRIWNRILHQLEPEQRVAEVAKTYGVGIEALKDLESRKRKQRVEIGEKILIEKREVIFAGLLEKEKVNHSNFRSEEADLLQVTIEELKKPDRVNKIKRQYPGCQGVIINFSVSKPQKTLRKASLRLRKEDEVEVLWWLDNQLSYLPRREEADGIIFSPLIRVSDSYTHDKWLKQVKTLLSYYPCTRLIIHFDLCGRERLKSGKEQFLTARGRKIVRINKTAPPIRIGKNGWYYYQYKLKEEAREALIPDSKTIREILKKIDALNLRGVLFTGVDSWEEFLKEEMNKYFLANPRILVMNKEE